MPCRPSLSRRCACLQRNRCSHAIELVVETRYRPPASVEEVAFARGRTANDRLLRFVSGVIQIDLPQRTEAGGGE
jgi:hypothetical protein